jgi:hypothetical protein
VTLTVYDLLGQQVALLVKGEQRAGLHTVEFSGSELPSGVYYYRLQAGDFTEVRRLLLLK